MRRLFKKHTPEVIETLKENEIFVFGSNEAGIHGAGAAKLALDRFGAKLYQGFGLQGQSFAIPTKDRDFNTLTLTYIAIYLKRFSTFATENPQYTFYMTKIGCGLAGISVSNMAELFRTVDFPKNVILPKEFSKNALKTFLLHTIERYFIYI